MNQSVEALVETNIFLPPSPSRDIVHFERYALDLADVLNCMPWEAVAQAADEIVKAWRDRRSIYVFGNGGSSSTAQHLAADFSKNTTSSSMPRLRAMCLSDNTALFTALSNDNTYEQALADQISIYANPGDVAIAISASGNSPNVLAAVERAHSLNMITVGITGYHGGKLAHCAKHVIVVPCHDIEQIEDVHMVLVHMMTSYVRKSIARSIVASD